jgi:uncharacterized protein (TIGR02678 family)
MSATRDAIRALLAQPLVGDDQPDVVSNVRRHRRELERFFTEELGYRLDASRPARVRLAKVPGPGHVPRGMRTRSGRRFDARRYSLVCLVLASAEVAGDRTTLVRLFSDVAARAGGIDGLAFSAEVASDRRVFIQAVQAAESLGVLVLAEGDEERFARGEDGADALYRIDRERLALLPTTSAPPSLLSSPEQIAVDAYPDTEEGRVRRRRHRVMRALVEQPVVEVEDLTAEECEYLTRQRPRIERVLADDVGLSLEVRAEGWVAVDDDGGLSDLRWPDYGTAEVAALRICDELRARRLAGRAGEWPWPEVVAFVGSLATEYTGLWRQDAGSDRGAEALAAEAVEILEGLRLVRRRPAGVFARAAAGRFAAIAAGTAVAKEET